MSSFEGFSTETLKFFEDLAQNNTKVWFEAHRSVYDQYVLEPARGFVAAMGEKLHDLSIRINAIPKVNQSLFRINREPGSATTKDLTRQTWGSGSGKGPGSGWNVRVSISTWRTAN